MSNIDLWLGDCLDLIDNIEDQSVDIVLTDPPYGISHLNSDWNKEKIDKAIQRADLVKSLPSTMRFNPSHSKELGEFLFKVAEKLYPKLKSGSFCLVFSQPRSVHRVAVAFEDCGFEFRDQLLWDYGFGQGKAQSMDNFIAKATYLEESEKSALIEKLKGYKTAQLTPTYESILLFQKPKKGTLVQNYLEQGVGLVDFRNGSRSTRFIHKKPSADQRAIANYHPTLKPLSLMVDLLKVFSKENDLVLDCFMGSGTTGVACLSNNRRFIGIELNDEYFQVAEDRIYNDILYLIGE